MTEAGAPPGAQILSALLPHHARFGGLDALLATIERHQIVLDQYGFVALLAVHAREGRMKEARAVAEVMRSVGCPPGQHAYNLLIEASGRAGQPSAAMRDYREMLELGVRPSPHTYNSLYRSISAAAWSLREEGGGLPEEEDEGWGNGDPGGAAGAGGAADGAERGGEGGGGESTRGDDGEEVRELRERLWGLERERERHGLRHSVQSFTALLQALESLGLTPQLLEVVERAAAEGAPSLDTVAFNVALGACMRSGEAARGFRMYDLMLAQGVPPSLHTFNSLINGCAVARQPDRALEVLESIWAAGRKPNQVTANTLVKAFVLSGDLEGAVRAVGDLGARSSLIPSPHALDMLIGACERQQRQDVIDSLYDALAMVDAGLLSDLDADGGPKTG